MKTVAVLLSTYNGDKYLEEQINSLLKQEGVEIKILVRDDGSIDSTLHMLEQWKNDGKLNWYTGDNLRAAFSFLDLIINAPEADYYALCDQDDVWDSNKLMVAIDYLKQLSLNKPALYAGRTRITDADLAVIKVSNLAKVISFGSSMLKNFASGCTMVFNKALLDIIKVHKPATLTDHDWWICNVCLAVDGKIFFDKEPHMKYRQHGNNVVGGYSSTFGKYKFRINKFMNDKSHTRVSMAKEILKGYIGLMDKENIEIATSFSEYQSGFLNMVRLAFDKRIRCGFISDDILFKICVLVRYL